MLRSIFLKNYLFFEDFSIDFTKSLTTFTGETGAGKSILVQSIRLAFGEKVRGNIFLDETKSITIILHFTSLPAELCARYQDFDCAQEMIIKRIISNSGSKYYLNDIPCTQKTVRELQDELLEFTGQHNATKLKNADYQLELLDTNIASHLLQNLASAYDEYKSHRQKLEAFREEIAKSQQESDYLEYVLKELQELNPEPDEESQLLDNIKILKNHKNIAKYSTELAMELENIRKSLNNSDKLIALLDAKELTKHHTEALNSLGIHLEELDSAQQKLEDSVGAGYAAIELENLEDRLFKLREYARKYRRPVAELASYTKEVALKLSNITRSEELLTQLERQAETSLQECNAAAATISRLRHIAAAELEKQVNKDLSDLKMPHAQLRIKLEQSPRVGRNGYDIAEFLIKTNAGRDFEQLSAVASGGELSRVMLAIKCNIPKNNSVLYIFDEIDTGISGAVSTVVGKKLKKLATHHQIFVITHQPQVAVFADHHYVVAKSVIEDSANDNRTLVDIVALDEKERDREIARMLSGEVVTSASLQAAETLRAQSL